MNQFRQTDWYADATESGKQVGMMDEQKVRLQPIVADSPHQSATNRQRSQPTANGLPSVVATSRHRWAAIANSPPVNLTDFTSSHRRRPVAVCLTCRQ